MFDLKSPEELSLMTLDSDTKFEEKLTFGLENNIKNLANFHQSTIVSLKIGNPHDGILLSKVENI